MLLAPDVRVGAGDDTAGDLEQHPRARVGGSFVLLIGNLTLFVPTMLPGARTRGGA